MFKKYILIILPLLLTIIFSFFDTIAKPLFEEKNILINFISAHSKLFVIFFLAWTMVAVMKVAKQMLLKHYDISAEDNLKSRKVHTQINILERIVIFTIILFSVGLFLLSFEKIREIGVGLFASAGLAGIIIGLAAQRVVGSLLAGLQIAFTQPFRIEDAVLVENEWGWIEEINLTYVVVRLWDKRRLVLPSTYFIEKPFQNWTRNSADILGSVFIHTDYSISFSALREELTRLLESTPLWDRQVNVLQVTEAKESSVEIRILVSAKNSPTAWDLRVFIREKLIEFIQQNYPQAFPRTRVMFEGSQSKDSHHLEKD